MLPSRAILFAVLCIPIHILKTTCSATGLLKCPQDFVQALSTRQLVITTFEDLYSYGSEAEDNGYDIDNVKDCILPLFTAGSLNKSLPITDLRISGNKPPSYPFNQFLANLTHLERLHWNAEILPSKPFLDHFESIHPNVSLLLEYVSWRSVHVELLKLTHRKSLTNVKVTIEYGGEGESHMKSLERLLYAAPNVTELELNIRHNGGCLRSDGQPFAFDFHRGSGLFPSVKILKLRGYRFDAISDGDLAYEQACRDEIENDLRRKLRKLFIYLKLFMRETFQPHKSRMGVDFDDRMYAMATTCPTPRNERTPNIQKWLQIMDWSKIETIIVDESAREILKVLVPEEKWLEKVEIWNSTTPVQESCMEFGLSNSGGNSVNADVQDINIVEHEEL